MPGLLQVAVAVVLWFLAGATFWGLWVTLDIQFVTREDWGHPRRRLPNAVRVRS